MPGHFCCYPLGKNLEIHGSTFLAGVYQLEEVALTFLRKFSLNGTRGNNHRGVWIKDKQVASIGIGVSQWVAYHGMAINIDMDLSYFDMIFPCGTPGVTMGHVCQFVDQPIAIEVAKKKLAYSFAEVFDFEIAGTEKVSALA